jgi:pectin methylesterase-like acyl-CoA thioesterase
MSVIILLLALTSAQGFEMTAVNRQPANGATDVCVDTKLWITWGSIQTYIATGGNLKIRKASDNSVVYTLNLQSLPANSTGYISTDWPYQITLAGKTLNYVPFSVTANVLEVQPSVTLQYNTTYYVTMTAGFCFDGSGRTSPAITDSTTWRFTTRAAAPAVDGEYTVAGDGSADFCTIQGAVNAVADNSGSRTLIKVRTGTYREIIYVPSAKKKITLLGEDRDTTAVAAYNNTNFNPTSTSYRAMIEVNADDFRVYNMTFRNTTPQGGSQAETFYFNNALRCLASNCKFYSYQDTLLITGTMYFADCYIEGDVDYMWGYGSAFFERCQLNSMRTGGYNLMPRNGNGVPGYIFVNCTLTAPAGITGVYLARDAGLKDGSPYFPYGQVVYIECKMGTHIASIGWKITDGYSATQLFLAEYHSMDLAGNLLNVSGRDYRSRQLSAADATYWRTVTNVLGGWDPTALTDLPTAAWQPKPADSTNTNYVVTLKWAAGAAATSHTVYLDSVNPPTFFWGTTTTPSISVGTTNCHAFYWRVDETNANGTTTGPVWSFTTVSDGNPPSPDPMTWATVPYATGTASIQMTATTATDTSGVEYYFFNYTDPAHDSGWQNGTTFIDTGLTPATAYAYGVIARDKSSFANVTSVSAPRTANTNSPPDMTPPSPDPMTWAVPPQADDLATIRMTATTATDPSGVQYYFTCTSGGGHDSGWQDSPTYFDGGLSEGVFYTYTVSARDKSPQSNTTAPSVAAGAYTVGAAPIPDPMTFSVPPHATGIDSIAMTATIAIDSSGVEYFFANITDPGHVSGWQDDPNWTDTGLTNKTTYGYRVIARDKTPQQNETAWSEPNSATTRRYMCPETFAWDLSGDCQLDFADYSVLANAWLVPPDLTNDIAMNGSFDAGVSTGWQWTDLAGATGSCSVFFDDTYGNPLPSVYLMSDTASGPVSGHRFYQVLAVNAGSSYRLSGDWAGDLNGTFVPDPCSNNNWAEVIVSFQSGSEPSSWSWTDPTMVAYRKEFGPALQNIDSTGLWDWQPFTGSATNGPSDGIFTATGNYMVIAFSLGGAAGASTPWFSIDNIMVEGPGCPSLDLDSNCRLDLKDIAILAEHWLTCTRYPAEECWL